MVVQYGWPAVFALVMLWLGKMANKFLDNHLANMDKIVSKLDDHGAKLADHSAKLVESNAIGEENSTKLDSLLARARTPTIPEGGKGG